MGNSKYRKTGFTILIAAILVLSAVMISSADGVAPGSEQDPIVTQSYVEQKAEQIKYYIDSLIKKPNDDNAVQAQEIEKLKQEVERLTAELAKAQASTKFEVVELAKNQILIAGEGAEIIPRSGKFTAIAGTNGNLSDISAAKDLSNGEAAPLNHMLIASRGDGRGIKVESDKAFLIIKGTYTLK